MKDVRLSLSAVVAIVAVASAASFAAGRSLPSAAEPSSSAPPSSPPSPPAAAAPMDMGGMGGMGGMGASDELPPGHPPTTGPGAGAGAAAMPAGHPPVDSMGQGGNPAGASDSSPAPEASLEWKAPPRWQSMPNASAMRLATYRIPRAAGDSEDGDLSIMQAGGTVDANVDRWIGQFDAASQKTAKRTTRKVGGLDVTIIEVQGSYSGGMGKAPAAGSSTALLGAIVATPGMPHFFKLTGPAKTVTAARTEFDAMLTSLVSRSPHSH